MVATAPSYFVATEHPLKGLLCEIGVGLVRAWAQARAGKQRKTNNVIVRLLCLGT